MKRGFLLRVKQSKVITRGREPLAPSTVAVPLPGFDADRGNPANALPSDYDIKKNEFGVFREFDPRLTEFNRDKGVAFITSIPQPGPNDEIQCEWIVNGAQTKAKVVNAPGYPARVPEPSRPDLYQVRSTDTGQGVFAKHDIKSGEIILAERPLIVAPRTLMLPKGTFRNHYTDEQNNQIVMFEFERVVDPRALPT